MKVKENQSHGQTAPGKTLSQNSVKAFEKIDTQKELAKIAGVSHDTIARGELALKRKHIIAAKARENQACGQGGVLLLENSPKAFAPINTRAEVAKIAGVSDNTIARVEKIVQKAPEEVLVPKTRPHIMPYPADLLSPGLLTPPANGRA